MFFSKLAQQFERLSEQLAPIPTDPVHRFTKAVQTGDVNFALALLSSNPPPLADGTVCSPLDPFRSIFNKQKGTLAIHCAAEHAQVAIVRSLISQYGVSPEQFDTQGNSPLHYAASSIQPSSLELVKILVTEFNVSVTVKNAMGQTPYDISKQDRVRQYLLPIQLQKETQECLDNGGHGLPPGIDLGGISLNRHVPPPPTAVGGGFPTSVSSPSGSTTLSTTSVGKYAVPSYGFEPPNQIPTQSMQLPLQPPVYNAASFNAIPTTPNPNSSPAHYNETQYQVPIGSAISINPSVNGPDLSGDVGNSDIQSDMNTDYQMNMQPSVPDTNSPSTQTQADATSKPPSASLSGRSSAPNSGYARRGFSTAAVLPSNAKYKPDGFHSSSSDVNLQQKYGHDPSITGPPSGQFRAQNLGPPPSVGSSMPYAGYSSGGAVANQYSAYASSGFGRPRYPTYDAISDTVGTAPGYMMYQQPTIPTSQYNIYSPATASQYQQPTDNYGNFDHNHNSQIPAYSNFSQGHQYYSNDSYASNINASVSQEYYSQQQGSQYYDQSQQYNSEPYQDPNVASSYTMPDSVSPMSAPNNIQTSDSNDYYTHTHHDPNITSPYTDSVSPMTESDSMQSPSALVAVESTERVQSVSSANDLFSSPPSGDSSMSASFQNVNIVAVESTKRESSVTSASELFSSPSSLDATPSVDKDIQDTAPSIQGTAPSFAIESSIQVNKVAQNPSTIEDFTSNEIHPTNEVPSGVEDSLLPPPPFSMDNFEFSTSEDLDELPPPPMIDISLS